MIFRQLISFVVDFQRVKYIWGVSSCKITHIFFSFCIIWTYRFFSISIPFFISLKCNFTLCCVFLFIKVYLTLLFSQSQLLLVFNFIYKLQTYLSSKFFHKREIYKVFRFVCFVLFFVALTPLPVKFESWRIGSALN